MISDAETCDTMIMLTNNVGMIEVRKVPKISFYDIKNCGIVYIIKTYLLYRTNSSFKSFSTEEDVKKEVN